MRILLVDDDAMSRDLLRLLLEAEGHAVETAESGEAAVATLRGGAKPELILADMQMPGLCGSAFAVAVRGDVETEQPALLAMSGSQPSPDALAGFDGFLRKPFTMEALAAAVDGARRPVWPLDDNAGDEGILDEIVYARLRASMATVKVAELYALCLGDTRARIERMRTALRANDDGAFRRGAHAIRGGCGMIGATELKALAATLEEDGIGSEPVAWRRTEVALDGIFAACKRLEGMLERRWES